MENILYLGIIEEEENNTADVKVLHTLTMQTSYCFQNFSADLKHSIFDLIIL